MFLLNNLRKQLVRLEGKWFDATRHIRTSGFVFVERLTLAGRPIQAHDYLPSRPSTARRALASAPVSVYSDYTFIDLGSGKGRVLFLAAETPYKKIVGVEFASELHSRAVENIRTYRCAGQKCDDIQSLRMNAADYHFPEGNLVVFLFNPFGPDLIKRIIDNLLSSFKASPRHIILILFFPENAGVVDRVPEFIPHRKERRFCIYQLQAGVA